MSRADYAHWNEDADYMWWHEEGKHHEEPAHIEYDSMDRDAEDAYCEELAEKEDEQLFELLADRTYLARWPKAKLLIEYEIKDRGLEVPWTSSSACW